MTTIRLLLIFCLGICTSARAQFSDSAHYYFNYNSTGSINKTNDGSSYLLNNGFKFSVKKKTGVLNLNNNWIYGRSQTDLTNNDYNASLDFDLYQKKIPHFYYWGLANYTTSVSLKINNQLQTGAGAAYSLYDKPNAYLNISEGLLFETSNLFLNDTTHDIYHTFRNSLRVQFRFVVKNIFVIDGSNFLQNSLSRGSDYIVRSNLNLSVKLQKWLSFTTAFNYNKFNRTSRENLLLSYGLSFEKYF
ncbi:DUF481 domain-containing protein [Deminuibacter soli]|uniref:DUF481 domain-containing protein n=1 Tax=Deminuibacter soli TaxID=2291815 RepID=A0A3E1NQD1_9BACT|nr:DUF481 domain-containing protein [Deminuibacter soli]RFM30131.1 DUF481 domain-containing protein [Deminuibacter soli]